MNKRGMGIAQILAITAITILAIIFLIAGFAFSKNREGTNPISITDISNQRAHSILISLLQMPAEDHEWLTQRVQNPTIADHLTFAAYYPGPLPNKHFTNQTALTKQVEGIMDPLGKDYKLEVDDYTIREFKYTDTISSIWCLRASAELPGGRTVKLHYCRR